MNRRVSLFGCQIDVVELREAVDRLLSWATQPDGRCRYVVTPNVNHVVLLERHERFRAAYAEAGMVLADGMPLVAASRLLKRPLPERVAGSDLVPALLDAANSRGGATVFLLGALPGVGERAAKNIEKRWPAVRVVGTYSPPLGFEKMPEENTKILRMLDECKPQILVVGLGAPKQELWTHEHHRHIPGCVALCAGATIDFLAGEKPRAPRWMRSTGLEWLHRVASEPRRLAKRYLHDAVLFPRLVLRELRASKTRACG